MNANDVLCSLIGRWPESQYLHLREAPLTADRSGTKADLVVLALWASKRYEIDVVEVKVSLGDFKREVQSIEWAVVAADGEVVRTTTRKVDAHALVASEQRSGTAEEWCFEQATMIRERWGAAALPGPWTVQRNAAIDTSKSDPWRQHAHRFWIAAPVVLAAKVRDDLPEDWGLLACGEGGSQVLVQAKKNSNPDPLPWKACIGMMRAAADSGPAALARHFDKGAHAAWNRAGRTDALNVYSLRGRPL